MSSKKDMQDRKEINLAQLLLPVGLSEFYTITEVVELNEVTNNVVINYIKDESIRFF